MTSRGVVQMINDEEEFTGADLAEMFEVVYPRRSDQNDWNDDVFSQISVGMDAELN